jgi:hypothetical protein
MGVSSNFDFLAVHDERLTRLGALAERYFFDDAPATSSGSGSSVSSSQKKLLPVTAFCLRTLRLSTRCCVP